MLASTATPQQILEALVKSGVPIERFEIATPSLHEIFIEEAGGKVGGDARGADAE